MSAAHVAARFDHVARLGTTALAYADKLSCSVFPLRPRSKQPLFSKAAGGRGCLDATRDLELIQRWWTNRPDANIGIACGEPSGFFVIDVDPRHGGDETLAELERRHGPLPSTPRAITGGGGRHIVFRHVVGLRNSTGKIGAGLDVRTNGGYIVAAPSMHPNGRRYAWAPDHHPLRVVVADAPAWLLARAMPRAEVRPPRRDLLQTPLDHRKLAGLVRVVARASEGERNSTLFWAACRVSEAVRSGEIVEDFGTAVLEEAAARSGLPASEARRTIASALRAAP